jgi:signal peptidase I
MGKKKRNIHTKSFYKKDETMEKKKFIREYVEPIVIAVLIALFIRTVIIQAFKIPSESMKDTLLVGDHILVNKFIYGIRIPYSDKIFGESKKLFEWNKPKRGDVIVFIFPKDRSKDFIKRVIGTEGEKVQIIHNKIYIHDKLIDDPWGQFKMPRASIEDFGPLTVPWGSLFVMGDNRDNSQDSRFWGFVNVNEVKGKAFIIYYSGSSMLNILFPWTWGDIMWNRFGKLIH